MKNGDKYFPFQGYDAKDSFVPPVGVPVGQGRINPDNIRYLYTSSDVETSILEVRARPDEYVSVADIEITAPLTFIDTAIDSVCWWDNNKKDEWFALFLWALSDLFRQQYVNSGDYYLCQYISEYWKNLGIDGIRFKSAMSRYLDKEGFNLTVFNYDKCKVTASKLYLVYSMTVKTDPENESRKG